MEPTSIIINIIESCTEVLTVSISASMTIANIDSSDLIRIYAENLDQLFESLAAESASSRRNNAGMSLQRNPIAPDLYTRRLIWNLVQAISTISALAVKISKPAQVLYIYSTASMTVYTNRIFHGQIAHDLDIELNGTNLRAKVPKAFFTSIMTYQAADITLAISFLSSALLPESFDPFILQPHSAAGVPGNDFTSYTPQAGWGTIERTVRPSIT